MAKEFRVGSRVRWESQTGGSLVAKEGKVVAIVRAGGRVREIMDQPDYCADKYNHNYVSGSLPRNHESYLVAVVRGTRARPVLYWPHVRHLELVARPHGCQEPTGQGASMKRTEIRRRVGELLGYRVMVRAGFYDPPIRYTLLGPNGQPANRERHTFNTEALAWGTLPHFDEDIAAAWQVVEFMTRPSRVPHAPGPRSRKFSYLVRQSIIWTLPAQEAALEICLMALRASGVEVGEAEEER